MTIIIKFIHLHACTCTVDLEIFVLGNFRMINFRVENFCRNKPLPIVRIRFRKIDFRSCDRLHK